MDSYIGQIAYFASGFVPQDWHLCDGTVLPVAGNEVLFAVIGTSYGGNGTTNFALPNLIGRLAAHPNASTVISVPGTVVGSNQVTLQPSELPQHTHQGNRKQSTDPLTSKQSKPVANKSNWAALSYAPTGATSLVPLNAFNTSTNATTAKFHDAAVTSAGGSQPHENRQPYLFLIPAICVNGIFPARS